MTWKIRLAHRIVEFLTGLATPRCECGFEDRCAKVMDRHHASHEVEQLVAA